MAEAYGKAGQAREGLTLIAEALAAAHDSGERHYEAELQRIKGELLLKAGGQEYFAEAETCFEQAIRISRPQQARLWELRATLSLCRLWQGQNKLDSARQRLTETYSWFTDGFDTPDLREVRLLLDELKMVESSASPAF